MEEHLDLVLDGIRQKLAAKDTGAWAEKEARLLTSCHEKQRQFVLDPGRRIAALTPRGVGKTTGGRARLVRRMLRTPKAQCLYIATTRQQAEELMWAPLKDLLEKLGVAATFNETKLLCTLHRNGARLRLVGADDKREIEKLRGQPFHEVGIDEAASFDPKLIEHLVFRIIAPRLGDYNGVLWLIGTPGHVFLGPYYDVTRSGSEISRHWADRELPEYADWKKWSFHSWTLLDGAPQVPAMARLWAEALLEKEANGWSDEHPVWRREYLGQWAADDTENVFKYRPYTEDGAEWNVWTEGKQFMGATVPAAFDPESKNPFNLPAGHDWNFVYGMDLGHSDPFSLQVFAYSKTHKQLLHVLEYTKRGMYARTVAELMLGSDLSHESPTGVLRWTGWPDGMVADTAGMGDAFIDELSRVYGISVEAAEKKNKHDAIELFNGDLVDGLIRVIKGSKLEQELANLQWMIDEKSGQLRENKAQANHNSDGAIYARRKANHLFAKDPPAPPPKPGSPAALNKKMDEAEMRYAQPPSEFDDLLAGPSDYSEYLDNDFPVGVD